MIYKLLPRLWHYCVLYKNTSLFIEVQKWSSSCFLHLDALLFTFILQLIDAIP